MISWPEGQPGEKGAPSPAFRANPRASTTNGGHGSVVALPCVIRSSQCFPQPAGWCGAASHLLPWVVMAGGLFSAGQVLSLNSFVELDSRSLLIPKIVTAVLGVGCNFAGARYFGSDGVVAGLLAFSVVYLVWILILVRRAPAAPQPTTEP